MRRVKASVCILILIFSASASSVMAADNVYTGFFGNTALGGYDAVNYFEAGTAQKGSKKYQADYAGAQWLFLSEEHLQLFEKQPEKYAPQYGGFCAWAVSAKKSRAPGDPEYWKIVDDKLYLNYDKKVQSDWLQDINGHIRQADINWPQMLEQ